MRAHPTMQMLAGACALMVSGCAYPHPGPSLSDDGALPAESGAAAPSTAPVPAKMKPAARSTAQNVASTGNKPSSSIASAVPAAPGKKVKTKPAPVPESDSGMITAAAPNSGPIMMDAPSRGNSTAAEDSGTDFDNVEVVDSSLKGKLEILRVGSEPTPNNLLSVFAGLRNKTSHRLGIEVQTLYKDKAGNALNQGSWIPMTLKPHEKTEYRSASISGDAADFLVRIRLVQTP